MADDPHIHDEPHEPGLTPERPVDSGSQALAEALRSSFGIVKVVMVVLVVVFIGSGVFKVGQDERAIILRLGRPLGTGESALLGPGLHLSFPYPIDDHIKVSVSGIKRAVTTVGWFATTPAMEAAGTEPPAGGPLNPAVDGYVLTADNNIIHSRATITYRISDPISFVFDFVNASNSVQNAADSALLSAASRFKVDDILYSDVAGFKEAVKRRVTQLVDRQQLGVTVEECLVESRPPRQLKEAFANVLKAEVTRSKVLNEARSYENQTTNRAGADAESRINLAESDRARLVNDVSSQADRFNDLLPKYRSNATLFVQQRLTETLGRVLTNVQDKIFVAESTPGQSKELRLQFNREFPKPKTDENKP